MIHTTDFRSVYMPYCLEKQNDGTYLILNRRYKPVGLCVACHIEYSDYPVAARIKRIGPALAKKLAFDSQVQGDKIYLYNDASVPTHSKENMAAYLEKLTLLAKLKIMIEPKLAVA